MPIQVLLGIVRVKLITLLTVGRLVPALRVSRLLEYYTVALGYMVDSGIILFALSSPRLEFIASNPMHKLTVGIIPTRLFSIIILGIGLLGFMRCVPPIIPGL